MYAQYPDWRLDINTIIILIIHYIRSFPSDDEVQKAKTQFMLDIIGRQLLFVIIIYLTTGIL
jgi:hypothetical protein